MEGNGNGREVGCMNGKMYAADLMTRQVRTVTAESGLSKAVEIMDQGGFGQVPVLEGDRPVKLLTEGDIRKALQNGSADLPVGELASPLPCLLTPEAPLSEVVEGLQERDSLLILEENGKLAGIITYWDVLQIARPHLLVAETELLLRQVVAAAYRDRYGPDWWHKVAEDIRRRAEEEHRRDRNEGESTPEHMLGHTSFYSLIEAYRHIRPDLSQEQVQEFHKVRIWRNQVAHLYRLSEQEVARLVRETLAMRDFLEAPASPACPT